MLQNLLTVLLSLGECLVSSLEYRVQVDLAIAGARDLGFELGEFNVRLLRPLERFRMTFLQTLDLFQPGLHPRLER